MGSKNGDIAWKEVLTWKSVRMIPVPQGEVSSLRNEIRVGFHTLNDTLGAMFNITASGLRANKEVAEII